jgi:hypothetical protein
MAEFVARLDEINAIADAAPGFVWRLKDENDNATAIRVFEDDLMIINMSVWESVEALKDFTYTSRHSEVMRKRRNWFEPHADVHFVMWWIPAGHVPTPAEAKDRLAYLSAHGPTEHAFTFSRVFAPPRASACAEGNRVQHFQRVNE